MLFCSQRFFTFANLCETLLSLTLHGLEQKKDS